MQYSNKIRTLREDPRGAAPPVGLGKEERVGETIQKPYPLLNLLRYDSLQSIQYEYLYTSQLDYRLKQIGLGVLLLSRLNPTYLS